MITYSVLRYGMFVALFFLGLLASKPLEYLFSGSTLTTRYKEQEREENSQAKKLFEEGVQHYKQNNTAQASSFFKNYLTSADQRALDALVYLGECFMKN